METTRTTEGLRNTLFDTLDQLLSGRIDIAHAKAITKVADSILKSAVVDIEYKKMALDVKRHEGPQAVADLNLNVALTKPKLISND